MTVVSRDLALLDPLDGPCAAAHQSPARPTRTPQQRSVVGAYFDAAASLSADADTAAYVLRYTSHRIEKCIGSDDVYNNNRERMAIPF